MCESAHADDLALIAFAPVFPLASCPQMVEMLGSTMLFARQIARASIVPFHVGNELSVLDGSLPPIHPRLARDASDLRARVGIKLQFSRAAGTQRTLAGASPLRCVSLILNSSNLLQFLQHRGACLEGKLAQ